MLGLLFLLLIFLPHGELFIVRQTPRTNPVESRLCLQSSKRSSFQLREWYELDDCLVLFPEERIPLSIIHFVGGFIAGSNVKIAYPGMLQRLANEGHLVVATEIPTLSLDHQKVAESLYESFTACYDNHLRRMLGSSSSMVPILGLSHSLGGKLTILSNSLSLAEKDEISKRRVITPRRYGNIFLSFNNFGLADSLQISEQDEKISSSLSLPSSATFRRMRREEALKGEGSESDPMEFMSAISDTFSDLLGEKFVRLIKNKVTDTIKDVDFNPSPQATWELFLNRYTIPNNFLLKFRDDSIDQSQIFYRYLIQKRLAANVIELPGNHLTPNLYIEDEEETFLTKRARRRASSSEDSQQYKLENQEFMKQLLCTIDTLLYRYHNDLEFNVFASPGLPGGGQSSRGSSGKGGGGGSSGGPKQKWDSDNY